MTDYDDLFAETAASESLFADKRALDPLREPAEIIARDEQQHQLAVSCTFSGKINQVANTA